jgi:hypothetical protein
MRRGATSVSSRADGSVAFSLPCSSLQQAFERSWIRAKNHRRGHGRAREPVCFENGGREGLGERKRSGLFVVEMGDGLDIGLSVDQTNPLIPDRAVDRPQVDVPTRFQID